MIEGKVACAAMFRRSKSRPMGRIVRAAKDLSAKTMCPPPAATGRLATSCSPSIGRARSCFGARATVSINGWPR